VKDIAFSAFEQMEENLDLKHAKLVSELDDEKIYWLKSRHKSLKMNSNTVIVYTKNSKNKWPHKICFSTDLQQTWCEISEVSFEVSD
jgi:hypothetical protein